MISGYKAGYVAGRLFTRVAKVYLTGKFINSTVSKTGKWAKLHKIDSKNSEVVTKNLFDCLEYLD